MIHHINKDGARKVTLKPCKNCGNLGHTAFICPKKPKKPMARTRMKKVGKVGKALADQRTQFIADNPPPYYCIYCTYLGWDMPPLDVEVMQVEHTQSKTHHPELRLVKGNLAVSCPLHNEQKSTKDIDQFLAILDREKQVNT